MIRIKVAGKVNLSLYVINRKDNGYHNLDSVLTSINIYDTIEVSESQTQNNTLKLISEIPCLDNNSIDISKFNTLRVADIFSKTFKTPKVNVTLIKGIPLSSGLGGSSASAAGVILAMCKLFDIDINSNKVFDFATAMGADVPFQLKGSLAHVQGIGDKLTFYNNSNPLHLVIAKGKQGIDTKQCFEKLQIEEHKQSFCNLLLIKNIQNGKLINSQIRNDLIKPAKLLNNEIEIIFNRLNQFKPTAISMSGSGSTVFAIFSTKEKCLQVMQTLKDLYYVKAVETISKGYEFLSAK